MPELPEVETVRRGLERFVVGRRVDSVEVGRERTVRRTSASALVDGLTGTTVLAANRRGKYLRLPLDSGDELMIHLRMSGQLLVAAAGSERPAHTHVVLGLDDGSELWFVDPRTFGEMVVFDPTPITSRSRCPSWRGWASTPSPRTCRRLRSAGSSPVAVASSRRCSSTST
jgi:formamidopyrimidine-DNA glycosylase